MRSERTPSSPAILARLRTRAVRHNARVWCALPLIALTLAGCEAYRQLDDMGECNALRISGVPPGPMTVGDTLRLRISLRDAMNRPVLCVGGTLAAWTSSAPQVVSVSSDGLLQALATGQSNITARQDRRAQTVTIRVVGP